MAAEQMFDLWGIGDHVDNGLMIEQGHVVQQTKAQRAGWVMCENQNAPVSRFAQVLRKPIQAGLIKRPCIAAGPGSVEAKQCDVLVQIKAVLIVPVEA